MPMNAHDRSNARLDFVRRHLSHDDFVIAAASSDASFRSYWRVRAGAASWIVMDAPPDREPIAPWLDIDARLRAAALHAPEVVASDATQGFVLMEDLGNRTYLPELTDASADVLYADALAALARMQALDTTGLPVYDRAQLVAELELMPEWFLKRHLGFMPNREECDVLDAAFTQLVQAAREQPQCFVHRDYHSRNLLIAEHDNPAIIDFQDAMHGPIAYDLASLLRDCYIAWPGARVDAWAETYRQRVAANVDAATFRIWFDLVGLQRHIKVLGIFCRLQYRDGKSAYLADLPRVLAYVLDVARRYPALRGLAALLERATRARDLRVPLPASALPARACAP
ncbi:MAG: phosphotransferase [Xanthomonadaceae bacterium]|nr:phosphotransferase [Xanthomonadaceae bacterium]